MRKFTSKRRNAEAARDITAATSWAHAEQHALRPNHGRLSDQQIKDSELLLLAASSLVRIR